MKKVVLLLILFLFTLNISAQDLPERPEGPEAAVDTIPKPRFALTYSPLGFFSAGSGDATSDSPGYNGKRYTSFRFIFEKRINKLFKFEAGVHYKNFEFEVEEIETIADEDVIFTTTENQKVLSLPFSLKMEFMDYFFARAGASIDFDMGGGPLDNQTGFGAHLGVGAEYKWKYGFSVFASPYVEINAILPMSDQSNSQSIFNTAMEFGIFYAL